MESMSILSLIANATVVVKIVMLILFSLSMVSWYRIWQRYSITSKTEKALQSFEERFWSGIDLSRLFVQVNTEPNIHSGQENIFRAGFKEFARLRKNLHSG